MSMSSEVWLNGQPPVGCECEFRPTEQSLWAKVKVLAIAGDYFWLDYPDDDDEPDTHEKTGYFRPLQTKDTEREEAIKEIDALLTTAQDEDQPMANVLYENGYHNGPKVNELSDEEIGFMRTGAYGDSGSEDYANGVEIGARKARDYILDKEK